MGQHPGRTDESGDIGIMRVIDHLFVDLPNAERQHSSFRDGTPTDGLVILAPIFGIEVCGRSRQLEESLAVSPPKIHVGVMIWVLRSVPSPWCAFRLEFLPNLVRN